MGAWGVGAFQDDTALDWLEGPFADRGATAVAAALDAVNGGTGTGGPDHAQGVQARAAAEAVATAYGQPAETLDPDDRLAISRHAEAIRALPDAIGRANGAVARIWADGSEINELWTETDGADWDAALRDLTARLARAERNTP